MWCFQVGFLLVFSITLAVARVVELPNGRLKGLVVNNFVAFTNIRYAEPPIRFEAAVPYERSWSDIRNATAEIVSCIAFGKRTNASEGQEDCLTLNVFTPSSAAEGARLPVVFFIPGGAFMFSSSAVHSPEAIMAPGSMVLVTINYRNGPLGFLSTQDNIIHGNFGLKDQLLALRWVKENVHLFGGDPDRILLVGPSAGGASVHLHMLRHETEELAAAAVSLSGTALNPWVMQKNPKEKASSLAGLVNCPLEGVEMKSCLQEKSIEEIHAAVIEMQIFLDNPLNVFGPVIEPAQNPHAFLTEEPRRLIEQGEIANIKWMVTFTTDEGVYNAAVLLNKNSAGEDIIEELNNRWNELAPLFFNYYNEPSERIELTRSESIRKKYMQDRRFSRETYRLVQNMFSDVLFINGIREAIQLHRMYGRMPVYGYVYGNPHNAGVGNFLSNDWNYQFGAAHGDDEHLILPITLNSNYTRGMNDETISRLLVEMFESFIVEGEPRFGDIILPENGNTGELTRFLQILQQNYCVGAWESYTNGDCQACSCYDYPTQRKINYN